MSKNQDPENVFPQIYWIAVSWYEMPVNLWIRVFIPETAFLKQLQLYNVDGTNHLRIF
jgi:hypothetical protein